MTLLNDDVFIFEIDELSKKEINYYEEVNVDDDGVLENIIEINGAWSSSQDYSQF